MRRPLWQQDTESALLIHTHWASGEEHSLLGEEETRPNTTPKLPSSPPLPPPSPTLWSLLQRPPSLDTTTIVSSRLHSIPWAGWKSPTTCPASAADGWTSPPGAALALPGHAPSLILTSPDPNPTLPGNASLMPIPATHHHPRIFPTTSPIHLSPTFVLLLLLPPTDERSGVIGCLMLMPRAVRWLGHVPRSSQRLWRECLSRLRWVRRGERA